LFCRNIVPAQSVIDAENPIFTEQKPLPIMGSPLPIGLNFCLQLTDFEIDFHPGNVFDLPPELSPHQSQRVTLRIQACAGLDCPSPDVIDELLPAIERTIFEQQLAAGRITEGEKGRTVHGITTTTLAPFPSRSNRDDEIIPLPTRELTCFCLELFTVGHFEWGSVPGSEQQWLKPRLDGIEIVDLQPTPMENTIECYLATTLRLGVLPNLMVPMEKLILDITASLAEEGLEIGQQVILQPAAVPGDVPNNPAIEEDQIKVFINLNVTEGGA
jgi:hypothetical protein